MRMSISKPLIFVVISVLVVALLCGSFSEFAQGRPIWGTHNCNSGFLEQTCCWFEVPDKGSIVHICQTCYDKDGLSGYEECDPFVVKRTGTAPLEEGVLENPPMLPSGPAPPLQGGVLEQLEQGSSPELGFSERQQQPPADQGVAEQPPATEGTQPPTVEQEPVPCPEGQVLDEESGRCVIEDCPEGQVLDEESGICVLEEPEVVEQEEPEQQSEPEEEQPSEESDSGDNGNN